MPDKDHGISLYSSKSQLWYSIERLRKLRNTSKRTKRTAYKQSGKYTRHSIAIRVRRGDYGIYDIPYRIIGSKG